MADVLHDLSRELNAGLIRGTKLYRSKVRLDRYGLESTLYYDHRLCGSHKLEIHRAAAMDAREMARQIREVFDMDPLRAGIIRIDSAVDVPDYSVEWFRQNVWVRQKRHSSEYARFVAEHKRFETLYFGKRPNVFRIYDKAEEQRINRRKCLPPCVATTSQVEQKRAYSDGAILTRVEREYGGGRVPAKVRTLGDLFLNAANLNPFAPLQFLPNRISEELVDSLDGAAFLKCQGVLRLIENHGLHETRRILHEKTSGNCTRLLKRLESYFRTEVAVSAPDLDGLYKEGVTRQFAA